MTYTYGLPNRSLMCGYNMVIPFLVYQAKKWYNRYTRRGDTIKSGITMVQHWRTNGITCYTKMGGHHRGIISYTKFETSEKMGITCYTKLDFLVYWPENLFNFFFCAERLREPEQRGHWLSKYLVVLVVTRHGLGFSRWIGLRILGGR